jgi:hypothetical protein
MIRVVALILCATAAAHGSTIMKLEPDELERGADQIVEGTIVARDVRTTPSGFETHAWVAVSATRKGASVSLVELVVQGDGYRQIVVGMPSVELGETARWFLRSRGDGTFRVYGWAQGKWPRLATGTYEPAPLVAERDTAVALFVKNGMVWPAAKIPVPYLIQNAGSDDVSLPQEIAAIDAAFATWQAVPCASLAFQNAGMTDLGVAMDGNNVILFVETAWIYGSEAAAATSIYPIAGQETADIAVNGMNYTWAIGPSNALVTSNVLDLQAVLTHEIGHFSGLGHSMRSFDTMYYTWKPWQSQRTLSIDDKLGLCDIYPATGDECPPCPSDETCTAYPNGMLCTGTPDPIGTPCNYDRVECDGFCLFTATDLSSGYCSKFCETNADCPLTHHCADAMAGSMTVKVCFDGAQPPPCASDEACPALQHCDVANGVCTFECRNSEDCGPDHTCDARGNCVYLGDGGCGCRSANAGGILGMLGLLLVGWRPRARS